MKRFFFYLFIFLFAVFVYSFFQPSQVEACSADAYGNCTGTCVSGFYCKDYGTFCSCVAGSTPIPTPIPNTIISPYESSCGVGKCTNGFYCCLNNTACCAVVTPVPTNAPNPTATRTPTPTPTPTQVPGPWVKLKNTSFISKNSHPIPQSHMTPMIVYFVFKKIFPKF